MRTKLARAVLHCTGVTLPLLAQAQDVSTPPRVDVVAPALLPGLGVARERLPYTAN